ncbi:MAG: hypothetical protein AB1567_01630 [bacterium]
MEVKSTINQSKVDKFIKKLQNFKAFFVEYKNMDIIGGVAGVRMDDNTKAYIEKKGLYSFAVADGMMRNINSIDFHAKKW